MNSNLKQIALNLVLLLLAFSVQTCVFPLLPFLSAYPNLMLILIFSFGRRACATDWWPDC